jgi:hypothetical protein
MQMFVCRACGVARPFPSALSFLRFPRFLELAAQPLDVPFMQQLTIKSGIVREIVKKAFGKCELEEYLSTSLSQEIHMGVCDA